MDAADKNALVTGGVKGIGLEVVKQLIRAGARVGVMDVDTDGLARLKNEFPECLTYECDITDPEKVDQVVQSFFERRGRIDILINNAGILYNRPLVQYGAKGVERHSPEEWRRVIDVNLNGPFYVAASVAERMLQKRTRGVIVNISSVSAAGNRGQSAYSAAKAGINALTATWAKELGVMRIRVAAVAPGYSDTPSTHAVLKEDVLREIKSEIPLRRLAKPAEIAQGVMMVIENDFFNGKVFQLDGGLVI